MHSTTTQATIPKSEKRKAKSEKRKAKSEKRADRLSRILALLHQGDTIEKHQLAQCFGMDLRTIERDLGVHLRGVS